MPQLDQRVEIVELHPRLGDPAVGDPEDRQKVGVQHLARRRIRAALAALRAAEVQPGRDEVALAILNILHNINLLIYE